MANNTLFALSLITVTALGGAAFGGSHKGHHTNDDSGHMNHMMHMMQGMHDKMHGRGDGMMDHQGRMSRHHQMGRHDMMGGMKKMLDVDGDGQVTPEEAAAQLQAKLKEYDADGNGSLSIAEYEALHSAMIREKMVDRFQHLDADGDGQITSDEMSAPARHMQRMHQMKMKSMASGSQSGMTDMDEENETQDN